MPLVVATTTITMNPTNLRLTLVAIVFSIALSISGNSQVEWNTLPPTTPARVWAIDENRRLRLPQPSQPEINETTRVSVFLETIVVNDDRGELGNNSEVAIFARIGEGSLSVGDPILLDAVRIREGQPDLINAPLLGSRFWTGANVYDFRLEMWEIDSDRISTQMGTSQYSYGSMKDLMKNLVGSGTPAAVTPHETAIASVLQPLLMSIVRHFEKPDPLMKVRFQAQINPDGGSPALIPLKTGRYVIEFPSRRPLVEGTELTTTYGLSQRPAVGSGKPSNYVVLNVRLDQNVSEQDARSSVLAFRERVKTLGSSLIPESLASLVQNQAPGDMIVGQLELNDLKRRYNVRRKRPAPNDIEPLVWFANQVDAGRVPSGLEGSPLFGDSQLRDAVAFIADRVDSRPALSTDNATDVFRAWHAFIASGIGTTPRRRFVVGSGERFRVESGADSWLLGRAKEKIETAKSLPPKEFSKRTKETLVDLLRLIDSEEPDFKLTPNEAGQVIEGIYGLFSQTGGSLQLPRSTGSASARAKLIDEWLRRPDLSFSVDSSQPNSLVLRPEHIVDSTVRMINARVAKAISQTEQGADVTVSIYSEIILPAIELYDAVSTDTEARKKIHAWLVAHSQDNVGDTVESWRQFYGATRNQIIVRRSREQVVFLRNDSFRNAWNILEAKANQLQEHYTNDPTFVMKGQQLREFLRPVREALRPYTGISERKLLNILSPVGTFTDKKQLFELLDDRDGQQFFIVFKNGHLSSSRVDYFDPANIIADLALLRNVSEQAQMDGLLRAIRYISWEGSDAERKREIFEMLTGPSGLTDFEADEPGNEYRIASWNRWLFERKPIWSSVARRFLSSSSPSSHPSLETSTAVR